MEVKLKIRQVGPTIRAFIEGMEEVTLCSIATSVCNADPTAFEDFQALAVKCVNTMVKALPEKIEIESYHVNRPG